MIKALLLIFAPLKTWEGIFRAQRSVAFVFWVYLLPVMALSGAIEGYGLVRWGKFRGEVPHLVHLSPGEAVVFETFQFVVMLILVIFNAGLLKSTSGTFQGRQTFTQ